MISCQELEIGHGGSSHIREISRHFNQAFHPPTQRSDLSAHHQWFSRRQSCNTSKEVTWNLLKMQINQSHPSPDESQILGVGLRNPYLILLVRVVPGMFSDSQGNKSVWLEEVSRRESNKRIWGVVGSKMQGALQTTISILTCVARDK